MDFDKDPTLQEWTREQPLSVLALDSADRAVLRIAGECFFFLDYNSYLICVIGLIKDFIAGVKVNY